MKKSTILIVSLLATGCAHKGTSVKPDEMSSFLAGKPPALQPYFSRLYEEGTRNAVLNFNRLGLAALENGKYDIAAKSFDESLQRIEAIYADNPDAEKARALWNSEKVKDFKGEPYERAMAFYYRGLLYLREGDYDNARASFLGANRQDQLAENQKYQSDFGVMDYLAGWTSHCQGDLAAAKDRHSKLAKQHPSSLLELSGKPKNFIAVVETGKGPEKQLEGKYKEKLTFKDGTLGPQPTVELYENGVATGKPVNAGDVYYQATTRGGRAIDGINEGKADFKETTQDIADATLQIGTQAVLNASSLTGEAALGMSSLGMASSLISIGTQVAAASTTPEADGRQWEGLPRNIYLYGWDAVPPSADAITFKPGIGGASNATPRMSAVNGQCGFLWGRVGSALETPPAANLISEDDDSAHKAKNQAFRNELRRQFGGAV